MGKEQPNERRDCGRRRRAFWQTTAAIRTVGSAEWLAGPPTVGTLVVLVPTHIPGLKGNTPAGKPDDAIGYAAEGAGFFGAQYDPANFPLSKELQLLGLSEQAWADILTSLREGKGKAGLGFGFSKAIARCASLTRPLLPLPLAPIARCHVRNAPQGKQRSF